MKPIPPILILLLTAHCSLLTAYTQELKPVSQESFTRGEKLTFRVFYDSRVTGPVTAGVAILEVSSQHKEVGGRKCFHMIGEGRSKGFFSWFFKVEDRFESYVDTGYLVPWRFIRRTHEGNYKFDDDVVFDQRNGTAKSRRAEKKVAPGTHDVISAFYFARTYDFSKAVPGDRFPITFFLDDSLYVSVIQFAGKEEISTGLGKIRCLRFKPMVVTGNVFSQPYPMDLWISDDKNHIPVLAKSAVIIGSIKMELTEYRGLANPFTALVEPKKK